MLWVSYSAIFFSEIGMKFGVDANFHLVSFLPLVLWVLIFLKDVLGEALIVSSFLSMVLPWHEI